jgi:hypothetical protein
VTASKFVEKSSIIGGVGKTFLERTRLEIAKQIGFPCNVCAIGRLGTARTIPELCVWLW